MDTLLVYVPKDTLSEIINADGTINRPDEFWLSKPDGWSNDKLSALNISASTYSEWTRSDLKRKVLLKG
jgi:hypothetical protein